MEEFRLAVTGATDEIEALEEFCRQYGVMTECRVVSAYEGVAVTVPALHLLGRFEVLAQCIAAYGTTQKPPLKASYFVPQKGHRTVGDYSFEAVAGALRETDQLQLDRDSLGTDSGPRA